MESLLILGNMTMRFPSTYGTPPSCQPLPSEEGTTSKVLGPLPRKPRPASGLDCLICAEFARQRLLGILSECGSHPSRKPLTLNPKPSTCILGYRSTSLTSNCLFVGPYSMPMPRSLRWSEGGGNFSSARYPCIPGYRLKVEGPHDLT